MHSTYFMNTIIRLNGFLFTKCCIAMCVAASIWWASFGNSFMNTKHYLLIFPFNGVTFDGVYNQSSAVLIIVERIQWTRYYYYLHCSSMKLFHPFVVLIFGCQLMNDCQYSLTDSILCVNIVVLLRVKSTVWSGCCCQLYLRSINVQNWFKNCFCTWMLWNFFLFSRCWCINSTIFIWLVYEYIFICLLIQFKLHYIFNMEKN